MSWIPRSLNRLWMASCRGQWQAFVRAARAPRESQTALLLETVRRNASTEFGRRHDFASINSIADFQQRVPLSRYEDLAADIDRVASGIPNVLVAEPVRLFQPTSGTSAGQKLIPYTASLQQEYRRMISAWVYNLFSSRPNVRRGKAYWSISPALHDSGVTAGGIPIGFDDDTAYLGRVQRWIAARLLAVPADVARIAQVAEFRRATLLHLLSAEDLSFVSIWSPTFLIEILRQLEPAIEGLADDLRKVAGARRAARVLQILDGLQTFPEKLSRLWPNLAVISCWMDAAAAQFARQLQGLFPHVELQPKGLLATEGCVTFPIAGRVGCALALQSHCFEFIEHTAGDTDCVPDQAAIRLADELEQGRQYSVVLTTGGGLYRYMLGDIVQVDGHYERCPLLNFVGRSGGTSDLVGEKLAEPFVRDCLEEVMRRLDVCPRFVLLAPSDATIRRYRLFVELEAPCSNPEQLASAIAADLQAALERNPYYRQAVQLQQLQPVAVSLLHTDREAGWRTYESQLLRRGIKAGDIKPAVLDSGSDWEAHFAPHVQFDSSASSVARVSAALTQRA